MIKFYMLTGAAFVCGVSALSQPAARPESRLSIGVGWTTYHPDQLREGWGTAVNGPEISKKTKSVLIGYSRQLTGASYIDIGLRAKMIQFYTGFSANQFRPDAYHSTANLPALDLTLSYAHKFSYRRFDIMPRAGIALFIAPLRWDTTSFADLGNAEFAYGYYGSPVKPGYTLGLNAGFRLTRRISIGADASLVNAFSGRYQYYYRERVRYSGENDVLYGMKHRNIFYGLNVTFKL